MDFGGTSIKGKAIAHLARREHSRAELERKLVAQWRRRVGRDAADGGDGAAATAPAATPPLDEIARALDDLAARGLQSDERTAASVLAGQGARLGSRRLQQTLQAKGLAADLVASAVQAARARDLERARALWQRRFGLPATTPAERAKQARFLAARGFPGEVIRAVLRGAGAAAGEDAFAPHDLP
jgi:regulatory protein